MDAFFNSLVEALKDKVGRKQIIAIVTILCLTSLAANGVTDWLLLVPVFLAGLCGMIAQTIIDYKYPRANGKLPGFKEEIEKTIIKGEKP